MKRITRGQWAFYLAGIGLSAVQLCWDMTRLSAELVQFILLSLIVPITLLIGALAMLLLRMRTRASGLAKGGGLFFLGQLVGESIIGLLTGWRFV